MEGSIPTQSGVSIPGETVISPRMLFWAFRYALGRQSYVVDDVAKEVARCVDLLTPSDRRRMLVEIDEARAAGRIGMACDDASWSSLESVLTANPPTKDEQYSASEGVG